MVRGSRRSGTKHVFQPHLLFLIFKLHSFAGNSDPSLYVFLHPTLHTLTHIQSVYPTAIAVRGSANQGSRAPAVPAKPGHLASKRGVEDLDFFIGDEALANAKTPGY